MFLFILFAIFAVAVEGFCLPRDFPVHVLLVAREANERDELDQRAPDFPPLRRSGVVELHVALEIDGVEVAVELHLEVGRAAAVKGLDEARFFGAEIDVAVLVLPAPFNGENLK
jgi:hypothetical protein